MSGPSSTKSPSNRTDPKAGSGQSDWRASFRDAAPYLGLGMQLAGTMLLFMAGGYALDRWLDSLPWLTLAGAAVGMVAVVIHIVRVAREMSGRFTPPRARSGPDLPDTR